MDFMRTYFVLILSFSDTLPLKVIVFVCFLLGPTLKTLCHVGFLSIDISGTENLHPLTEKLVEYFMEKTNFRAANTASLLCDRHESITKHDIKDLDISTI